MNTDTSHPERSQLSKKRKGRRQPSENVWPRRRREERRRRGRGARLRSWFGRSVKRPLGLLQRPTWALTPFGSAYANPSRICSLAGLLMPYSLSHMLLNLETIISLWVFFQQVQRCWWCHAYSNWSQRNCCECGGSHVFFLWRGEC